MKTGYVKWFNDIRGMGFISFDDGSKDDVFVNYREIKTMGYRTLKEGQKVVFDVEKDIKGMNAKNVYVVK